MHTVRGLDVGLAPDFQACIYDEVAYRAKVREDLYFIGDGIQKYLDTYQHTMTEEQGYRLHRAAYIIATAKLGVSVPYMKHEGFVDEREWRLVHIGTPPQKLCRSTPYGDAEYIEVPLSKGGPMDLHSVVTGPRCSQDDRDFARATLDRLGYAHVQVVASKVPLR